MNVHWRENGRNGILELNHIWKCGHEIKWSYDPLRCLSVTSETAITGPMAFLAASKIKGTNNFKMFDIRQMFPSPLKILWQCLFHFNYTSSRVSSQLLLTWKGVQASNFPGFSVRLLKLRLSRLKIISSLEKWKCQAIWLSSPNPFAAEWPVVGPLPKST